MFSIRPVWDVLRTSSLKTKLWLVALFLVGVGSVLYLGYSGVSVLVSSNTSSFLKIAFVGLHAVLVIGVIFLPFLFYFFFGPTTYGFTIPSTLSYVPNKDRKPWEVNAFFKSKDIGKMDVDAVVATLLDLELKQKIKCVNRGTTDQPELYVSILDEKSVDVKEYDVIRMIKTMPYDEQANAWRFSTKKEDLDAIKNYWLPYIRHMFSISRATLRKYVDMTGTCVMRFFSNLLLVGGLVLLLSAALLFFTRGSVHSSVTLLNMKNFGLFICFILLFNPIAVSFVLCAGDFLEGDFSLLGAGLVFLYYCLFVALVVLCGSMISLYDVIALGLFFLTSALLLRTFNGWGLWLRWRKQTVKEFYEWQAFKSFLSDEANLSKYDDRDLNMWKDWLVYASALGVGKKVVEHMRKTALGESLDDVISLYDIIGTGSAFYNSFSAIVLAELVVVSASALAAALVVGAGGSRR